MNSIYRHRARIAVTLVPFIFSVLHLLGVLELGALHRLDNLIYDARLRSTMPRTIDDRIVIVDVDEKSLAEIGRWPWSRDVLADLVDKLFDKHDIGLLGVDIVLAEPDTSSGLQHLRSLAANELKDNPTFAEQVDRLAPRLDFDARLATALTNRPVVLGYFFSDAPAFRSGGALPAAVFTGADLDGHSVMAPVWSAFGANLGVFSSATPLAGHTNSFTDADGVVRSLPLVARYGDAFYESLALAMFRAVTGAPQVKPSFSKETVLPKAYRGLESLELTREGKSLVLPVDNRGGALISFRGSGGPAGGSFRYVSAVDVLNNTLPPGMLQNKIVLLGTTALGLFDMRVTPAGETYPGVETHASVLSSMLDGRLKVKPDYAFGYEFIMLLSAGLMLAFCLPLLSAFKAVLLSFAMFVALIASNFWLYDEFGLALPLATSLVMTVTAFALNMSYGYFVESRSKRELANLFGTYVPPELVDEMVRDPDSYTMQATSRELTVMFCDMRGFTRMSESMEPIQLQSMLTDIFSRITTVIRANKGTIDKYMGDCVMAFWGAPVEAVDHAALAVKCAVEIEQMLQTLNTEYRVRGLPEIGVGIGINTGLMCVGDMGSDMRRSYTVIGDAVNLGSRLEGLTKIYGVSIIVNETTRALIPEFSWQELDKVRVKGKEQSVSIWTPRASRDVPDVAVRGELLLWNEFLGHYRLQSWAAAERVLLNLLEVAGTKSLYTYYAARIASLKLLPLDPEWDGSTQFGST
ncbi:adenylate/guanylate cyclase domain-containing protein [Rhodoferax sp.]|uniref:CHASE2 domain-containing protein n=1 Tax=Rhodoferax sp. TaxID=50421 RepID=UPI002ACDB537|nr:adenylate/guanylate cyclase domain-containing protein [Rhodoferax sp.]